MKKDAICEEKEICQAIATCNCGCSILKVTRYDWMDGSTDYGISLFKETFYTAQDTPFSIFLKRIKNAWFTLIGKEYQLFDIALNTKSFREFRNNVNGL